MNTKLVVLFGMAALIVLGSMFVTAETTTVEEVSMEDNPFVQPMGGGCYYFCGDCVDVNFHGACDLYGYCC